MKRISLGLPLTLSLAGTLGSLAVGSKQAHVAFGTALAGLSLLHAFQHRKVMLGSLTKTPWLPKELSVPAKRPQLPQPHLLGRLPHVRCAFPGHSEVAFYMPGRIRVYIRELKGNESYKKILWGKLEDFRKVGHLEMSSQTGSLLIIYDPEKAAALPALRPYLRYAAVHAVRNGMANA